MTINRDNYLEVKRFIANRKGLLRSPKTIARITTSLRHLLLWADSKPFTKARLIEPTFPAYLLHARNDRRRGQLAPASLKKITDYARIFFLFCRQQNPNKFRNLSDSWIDTLRPPSSHGMQSVLHEHKYYSIEDVLKIATCQVSSLREERDRAAICFLFLSGMRIGAFTSLPASCVDLPGNRVLQLPERGVRTKNSKAAITYLLDIPPLMEVVSTWDARIRAALPEDALWFALISRTSEIFIYPSSANDSKRAVFSSGLKRLCDRSGVRYLSPHKLRHGHVVYALQRVRDMAGMKSVSANIMHKSATITDQVYGQFLTDDVKAGIAAIRYEPAQEGQPRNTGAKDRLARLLKKLIEEDPGILNDL